MQMGLISDTHITQKRGKLPDNVFKHFKYADLIIHAGDITQEKVLDELRKIAPVIAVAGNNDKLDLNKTEIIEAENFKIAINHATNYSDDFKKLKRFASKHNADILVTGHTHRPHFKIIDDILFINPGSSNRPIKSDASVAVLNIGEKHKKVSDIEVKFIKL